MCVTCLSQSPLQVRIPGPQRETDVLKVGNSKWEIGHCSTGAQSCALGRNSAITLRWLTFSRNITETNVMYCC